LVEFVALNTGMVAPLPLAAKLMAVLLFVHAKVAPVVLLAKVISVEFDPAQMV